jgi:hypothetical protein
MREADADNVNATSICFAPKARDRQVTALEL